jgi:hypothetical protein
MPTIRELRASVNTSASGIGDNRQSIMGKFRSSRTWEDRPKSLIYDPYLRDEGQLIFPPEFIKPQCVPIPAAQ